MALLLTKGLSGDAVTGAKFRLDNNEELRARNAGDSADVNLLKLDGSDVLQFLTHPEISSSASSANQVLTKKDLDAAVEGLKPKEAVQVATTANITLSGEQTIDGVLTSTSRVLVKDQTSADENGIYVSAAGAWSRSSDMDVSAEVSGAYTAIQSGTAHAGKVYVQSGTFATLDTDNISFVFFNSLASISGGDGITFSGNVISIDHDGEGLTFATAQLSLELDGGTLSKSGTGLKIADNGVDEAQLSSNIDAESFQLSAGYLAAAGTVAIADTVEVAIEKIVGNIAAIDTPLFAREKFTLISGDVTNGYVDLAQTADGATVTFVVQGMPPQLEGVDYTLSDGGGFTRVTFAGDLASGGAAPMESGDVVHVQYSY